MLGYLALGSHVPCVVSYHSDIVRQRVLGRLTAPVVRATLRRSAAILVASPQYLDTSTVLQPFRRTCHIVPYGFEPVARRGLIARRRRVAIAVRPTPRAGRRAAHRLQGVRVPSSGP